MSKIYLFASILILILPQGFEFLLELIYFVLLFGKAFAKLGLRLITLLSRHIF